MEGREEKDDSIPETGDTNPYEPAVRNVLGGFMSAIHNGGRFGPAMIAIKTEVPTNSKKR